MMDRKENRSTSFVYNSCAVAAAANVLRRIEGAKCLLAHRGLVS